MVILHPIDSVMASVFLIGTPVYITLSPYAYMNIDFQNNSILFSLLLYKDQWTTFFLSVI